MSHHKVQAGRTIMTLLRANATIRYFSSMRITYDVNNAHACIKRAYKLRLRVRTPAQSRLHLPAIQYVAVAMIVVDDGDF